MKNLTPWIVVAAMLLAFNTSFLKAENPVEPVSIDSAKSELVSMSSYENSQILISLPEAELALVSSAEVVETAHGNTQLERLNEIKEMDLSAMSSSEKNELRKEVRAIEKDQRPSGGIYISVGAAILIVLLLILLL